MIDKCASCKNADPSVTYSNWHYCTNPDNFRDFTIVRHRCDFTGIKQKPLLPSWCPFKNIKRTT